MTEDTRTLLEEFVDERYPLGRIYHVCRNRLCHGCGFKSDEINAEIMDNHYLIMREETFNSEKTPLAIVDITNRALAEDRFYQEAIKVAKLEAKLDGNKVIDLSLRNNKLSKEDKYYARGLARTELMIS